MDSRTNLDRERLTFEEAEGLAPLPAQLRPKEISSRLRARLWHVVHAHIETTAVYVEYRGRCLGEPWSSILKDHHVQRLHQMVDKFSLKAAPHVETLSAAFERGNYSDVYGFIQFILRHRRCPDLLRKAVAHVLSSELAGYRVHEGTTLIPVASEEEARTALAAFGATERANLVGAREHLLAASAHLASGKFADSVRESIHAVESTARVLGNANSLRDALTNLERSVRIHPALRSGFERLYGYTSDEKGVRHALLDASEAAVDEADALFMFGACAAFITYLVSRTSVGVPKADV